MCFRLLDYPVLEDGKQQRISDIFRVGRKGKAYGRVIGREWRAEE